MDKEYEVLLKRADYEFNDSQMRLKENNSLIKTALGFFGAIASFIFYTKLYDALFLISGIAVVFGLIWLEDQVKIQRKMFIKKSILKEILGKKKYKEYDPKYSRSLLDANSYRLSGLIAFIVLGTLPSMFYSMKFLLPSFMPHIMSDASNPILINSYYWYWLSSIYLIFTSLFTIYFIYVIVRLGLDKSVKD